MGKFINNLTSTVAIALLLTILSDGALVNRTIDDNNLNNLNVTNVTYIGRWIHSTDCGDLTTQTVDACSQTIDSSRVLDHTWTGTVYNGPDIRLYPTLSLAFNGTSVYVYHIIPAQDESTPSEYNIAWSLDNGNYTNQTYTKSTETQYDQLAFSVEGLDNTQHSILANPGSSVFHQMTFDYALYTDWEEDVPASPHLDSHPRVSRIWGAVVGGIGGIGGIICFIFFIRRRRHRRNMETKARLHSWDISKGTMDSASTLTQPQGTRYIMVQVVPHLSADNVQTGLTSDKHLSTATYPPSPVSVQPSDGGQQAHTVTQTVSEHRQLHLSSDDIPAEPMKVRQMDTGGTAQLEYVTMLETQVDLLQTQLNLVTSNDVPPSYYTDTDRRLSSPEEGRLS